MGVKWGFRREQSYLDAWEKHGQWPFGAVKLQRQAPGSRNPERLMGSVLEALAHDSVGSHFWVELP